MNTYSISTIFFTSAELKFFKDKFGYNVNDIFYSSDEEIDMSLSEEKDFLFKEGIPRILARFYAF